MAVPFAPVLPRSASRLAPFPSTPRSGPRLIALVPPADEAFGEEVRAPERSGSTLSPHVQTLRSRPADRTRPSRAVYRRRRLVLVTVATLAVLGAIRLSPGFSGGGPLTASGEPGSAHPVAALTYVVQPGDTVWSIAHHFVRSGDERPLVDAITAELHGTALVPGQAIGIP